MRRKISSQEVEHLDEHGITQGVIDLVPVLPIHDNPLGAQDREMLRGIGLPDLEPFDQHARGDLAVAEANRSTASRSSLTPDAALRLMEKKADGTALSRPRNVRANSDAAP
jgi:hypothetical protein